LVAVNSFSDDLGTAPIQGELILDPSTVNLGGMSKKS
jgi:hypothetical protein